MLIKLFCSFCSPQQILQGHFQCLDLVILLSQVGILCWCIDVFILWNWI